MRYLGRLFIWCAGGFVFGVTFANTLAELLERQDQKREHA